MTLATTPLLIATLTFCQPVPADLTGVRLAGIARDYGLIVLTTGELDALAEVTEDSIVGHMTLAKFAREEVEAPGLAERLAGCLADITVLQINGLQRPGGDWELAWYVVGTDHDGTRRGVKKVIF